ncbi:MAG: hypothetical protein Q9184_002629 [Pyrenodesmia sp. 2 TL-2023]
MTLDRPTETTPNARPSTTTSTNAPRVAGRGPPTPSNVKSPASTTTTPLLRKGVQAGTNQASATENNGGRATPVKALSSNITPRSGSRKARVDSTTSTPRRTPDSTRPIARPSSMIEGRDWPSGGPKASRELGPRAQGESRPARAQSVVSEVQYPVRFSPVGNHGIDRESKTASPELLPKFFHANEAKLSRGPRPLPQSPRLQPRLAEPGHAIGLSSGNMSALSSSPEPANEPAKFVHSDGTQPSSPPVSRPINTALSARPPLQTIFSSYQATSNPVQRPPSPLKEEVMPVSRKSSLSKPSPRRHTQLVSRGAVDIRAPETMVRGPSDISRRSSLHDSSRRVSQPQSPVTASFAYTASRRSSIALSDSGRRSVSMMSPEPTAAEPHPLDSTNETSPQPIPSSPGKPARGQSKLDHLNELAANARRERKVLDLEISNSSLLAINRTLETEMRKQKAELRQLRRLRSSGRFPSSTRSPSSRFSMPSVSDDMSLPSSADEDDMDDDRFSNLSSGTSDDTSFPDSLSFSPTIRNSSIPVAKGRRKRSFRIDFSAQRVLLLDSQKLNQALKRCLTCTDELIADGKRALEYRVNTGEVANLGPKVLTPGDRGEEPELGRGLLSPDLYEKSENPWEWTGTERDTGSGQQSAGLEGLMLEGSAHSDQADIGNEQDESNALMSEVHDLVDAIHQDTTILESMAPVASVPELADTMFSHDPKTHDKLAIPYEDPGIDTGGETPSSELEAIIGSRTLNSEDPTYSEHSSDEDIKPEEEPTMSSPSKGLGDFLRMVGGSWGV